MEDFIPGLMLFDAMDAVHVPGPALLVSSDFIKVKQPLSLTSVSSAGSALKHVLSKERSSSSSRLEVPKQGILLTFPVNEWKNIILKRRKTMPEKLKANYVDHICIAVNDVKKAEKDYVDAFGWEVAYRYVDEPEKIRVTGFMVGQTAIEIMEDLDGTGEVAKFIRSRGEGVMLISFNVDSCQESLEVLKKNRVRLIDEKPRYFAEHNRNFAFIHPAATHGVLTEIIDGKYNI